MPSKDTTNFHLTIKSLDEIKRIRKVMSEELKIPQKSITLKMAETAFRLKAQNGKIMTEVLRDIIIGKIK